jgi:hypothetical protein
MPGTALWRASPVETDDRDADLPLDDDTAYFADLGAFGPDIAELSERPAANPTKPSP